MSGRGILLWKSIDFIGQSQQILAAIQPTTIRSVCYQLFTRGLIENMGSGSTHNVSRLLVIARERGIIPWEWIVDETRQEARVSSWNGLGDFGETVVRGYRKDFWQHQKSWIKVFSEKGTVGGIVRPVLDEFAVSFQVLHGFGSATSMMLRKSLLSAIAISKFSTSAILIRQGCTCPGSICLAASKNMAVLSISRASP